MLPIRLRASATKWKIIIHTYHLRASVQKRNYYLYMSPMGFCREMKIIIHTCHLPVRASVEERKQRKVCCQSGIRPTVRRDVKRRISRISHLRYGLSNLNNCILVRIGKVGLSESGKGGGGYCPLLNLRGTCPCCPLFLRPLSNMSCDYKCSERIA